MRKSDYECTKCGKIYSTQDYKQSVYCPDCGLHLWQCSFSPTPFKVNDVFAEFMALNSFEVTEGIIYNNVNVWMTARKNAYTKYAKKLSVKKMAESTKWQVDFKNYLHFKYNQSWPKLQKAAPEALAQPEQLKRMLTLLQDKSVPVEDIIRNCLQGEYVCPGISKNILTSLLHTFWPAKYSPWGKYTDEALKKIKRTPIPLQDMGKHYVSVNAALAKLASELHTNLTAIDGFMWYIAKV
jgi:hypothetical protein